MKINVLGNYLGMSVHSLNELMEELQEDLQGQQTGDFRLL